MQLVQRTYKGISTTSEGKSVVRFSQSILERLLQYQNNSQKTQNKKIVTIAAPSYVNKYILSRVLPRLSNMLQFRFRLVEGPAQQLLEMSRHGVFDIAFHTTPLPWGKSWATDTVGPMSWGIFGRKNHPLTPAASVEKIKNFPFVVPFSMSKTGEFSAADDTCPIGLKERIHGDQSLTADTALHLIKHSDQLAYLPLALAQKAELDHEIERISVLGWKTQGCSLLISIKTQTVKAKFYNALVESVADILV